MNPEVQVALEARVNAMSEMQREEFSRLILMVARAFAKEVRVALVVNHPNGELNILPVATDKAEAMHLVVSTNEFCMQYSTLAEATRH